MSDNIKREETEKCDAFTKLEAEEDKVKRDLQKAKNNLVAVTAKLQEIVKKISEDQGQEENKTKLKAQLLVYENVLPFIQEELADARYVTSVELENG